MQLLEEGKSIKDIASKMRLTVPRTERYIEEEELARDLLHYRCDYVPVALVYALYEQRLEEDPSLNQSVLAREAKLDRTDLLRALGLAKSAPRIRNGQREPGEIQTEVGVETAAKIVRALRFDLHEVPGL